MFFSADKKIQSQRAGFTLLELLIFTAIFSFSLIGFITLFIVITQTQSRQVAVSEVNQQSQFLLQTIQRYVESASLIEMDTTPQTTLRLRMANSAKDPTLIRLNGGVVELVEGSNTPAALTSARVNVTTLSFVKRENPGGRDSVSVNMTIAYNSQNPKQQFSQALETAVARVSAATFDSNILPSSTNAYVIGTAANLWQSINGLIYFSGGNVGVGTAAPNDKLEVAGRLRVSGGNDIYVAGGGSGVILSNGASCYRITVTGTGVVTSTLTSCP